MSRESPNAALVGQPGSRALLQTPCLVLELPALQHNIDQMARFARAQRVALRPHAKTHKSVQIARRQCQAGAVGLCTATLGEAEALADGGIEGLLVTSPAIGAAKIARLLALAARQPDTMIVVDAMDNLRELAQAADSGARPLTIVVALDIGNQRIGARDIDDALALCKAVDASGGLRFGGIHAYAGSLQHTASLALRTEQARTHRAGLSPVGMPPG
ncbi:MAG: alanine racemase [Burkholderiaceae bacterium]